MRRLANAALAAALISGLAGMQALAAEEGRLTVTGQGQVAVAPDMATVTFGAVAEADEAADAMAGVGARMGTVLERIEAAGIAATDVQTNTLTLEPRWQQETREGPARIEGFVARSGAVVRVRDLDALGGLLDALVSDGANEFRGLSFGLQAPQPVEDEARRAAVADAIRKAELYAEAAGVTLGPILSIDEHGGGVEPRMMRAAMAESGLPVAAGEVEIAASVSITYAIGADRSGQ
ncbi:SIMPL domain-containing protein [Tropicimonas sp. IMCC6043]|uniref:SIMPL domain-containing protein n=1 Tax=Tropicimonas sp. IMCC6043 TaxID=2510645 RepID=UPI0013EC8F74|nr:SIMPL domain-containing protein [Tropicimonas sp. IMCC6043]